MSYEEFIEQFGVEMLKGDYDSLTEQFRVWFSIFADYKEHLTEQASQNTIQVSDGMTVVIGLVVVFAVLLCLTGIFYLFGFVMDKVNNTSKSKKTETKETPKKSPAPKPVPAPVVEKGISGEVVAAIAAAVASMAPEGKRYALKSVSRASNGRSAWSAAGIADNTRPF